MDDDDWTPEQVLESLDLLDSGDNIQDQESAVEGTGAGAVNVVVKCKLNTLLRDGRNKAIVLQRISSIVKDANILLGEAYAFANFHVLRLLEANQAVPIIDRSFYYRCLVAVGHATCVDKTLSAEFKTSLEMFDQLRPARPASAAKKTSTTSSTYCTNPLGKAKVVIAAYNQLIASLSIQMATMAKNHLLFNADGRLKRYLSWKHPSIKRFHAGIARAVLVTPSEDVEKVLKASSLYHKPAINQQKADARVKTEDAAVEKAMTKLQVACAKADEAESSANRADAVAAEALQKGAKNAAVKVSRASKSRAKAVELRGRAQAAAKAANKTQKSVEKKRGKRCREEDQLQRAMGVAEQLRGVLPIEKQIRFASRAHQLLPLYHWLLKETETALAARRASADAEPQTEMAAFQGRLFNLLPMKAGYTTSYIPISSMFFFRILRDMNISSHQGDGRHEDARQLWDRVFCLKLIETKRRRFAGSIMTDGYAVSALLSCPVSLDTSGGPGMSSIEAVREAVKSTPDRPTLYTGIDPGFRDVVTASCSDGTSMSYSSSRYYERARIKQSMRRTRAFNQRCKTLTDALQQDYGSKVSSLDRLQHFLTTYFSNLPVLLADRMTQPYRMLRFRRHVAKQRAVREIVDMLIGKNDDGSLRVIGFGDWSGGSQSPVSRKHCGPIQAIKGKLSQRRNVMVIPVPEYGTSKVDSNTWARLVNMTARETTIKRRDGTSKVIHNQKVHAVLHCNPSDGKKFGFRLETTWNRDVNASRNILMLLRMEVRGFQRPAPFCRPTKPHKT